MATIQKILEEIGIDPKKWENASARDQIMVILYWGWKHGKVFNRDELCELLKLPEDVVEFVLDVLKREGLVLKVWG